MKKTGTGKKYAIISAIIFAAIVGFDVYRNISLIFILHNDYFVSSHVLPWIIFIGLVVTLLIGKKTAIIVAAGVNALLGFYYYYSRYGFGVIGAGDIVVFFAYGSLAILIILSMKGFIAVRKIWYIPAILSLVSHAVDVIKLGEYADYAVDLTFIFQRWRGLLPAVAEIVALVFVGLWLKNTTQKKEAPLNEYAIFNPPANSGGTLNYDVLGGADKLKTYKELFDSGVLTQEEFELKKKQILG